ncbi:phosphoribosylformylglycinamidine synthase I [candidate division WOR-1 bacterium RIFOXYC2_FULL_37_10]|uniref:Phosphoribosylformylglycinamidine synthase subunit PurQ n=1 Tax=candidate division WOR-1 bacterium RIFOXYB2_FULL_37_13 TaxID=1802579 RepID=A0A1F4SRQ5_UNCSA|nr:MAG: phosphoribosylformylglycinamidine synthase I [candidate division WOR-1 bacterium RIFOXYB2_FULL_37_13]OGC37297.1 MAG: phosphoribosylformylglycinamidine synthase I [candidate division WOR-1 bacterium RIFOXYC2_FULL_37_10]
MKFGVIVFPGSNCDHDCYDVIKKVVKQPVSYLWHTTTKLDTFDCIILPGGFSYGDYLRCGAIARFAKVMDALKKFAEDKNKLVIGICNGFQILCEAGLLPGALQRNKNMHFICKHVNLKVENNHTSFSKKYKKGQVLRIPIAHGEGNYTCDKKTLAELKKNKQIVFTYYKNNPNGSMANIAGICNKQRNVLGMMPHPERASEAILGSEDGLLLFKSIESALNIRH